MRALVLLFALCLAAAPAQADQTDPRLNGLFAQLKAAPDQAAGERLEAQIWRIWLQHPNKGVYETTQAGIDFMNQGAAKLAEDAFTDAIGLNPDFAEAWNKRATIRFFMGDLKGSVEDCAQVLTREPRHFGALAGLGMIYMAIEDWPGAARWFREALAINPHMLGVTGALQEAQRMADGEET